MDNVNINCTQKIAKVIHLIFYSISVTSNILLSYVLGLIYRNILTPHASIESKVSYFSIGIFTGLLADMCSCASGVSLADSFSNGI